MVVVVVVVVVVLVVVLVAVPVVVEVGPLIRVGSWVAVALCVAVVLCVAVALCVAVGFGIAVVVVVLGLLIDVALWVAVGFRVVFGFRAVFGLRIAFGLCAAFALPRRFCLVRCNRPDRRGRVAGCATHGDRGWHSCGRNSCRGCRAVCPIVPVGDRLGASDRQGVHDGDQRDHDACDYDGNSCCETVTAGNRRRLEGVVRSPEKLIAPEFRPTWKVAGHSARIGLDTAIRSRLTTLHLKCIDSHAA